MLNKKQKKESKTKKLENRIRELEEDLARAVADYRNLQSRVQEERVEHTKLANRDLLLKLLPAFDTLFLANAHIEDEGLLLSIKKVGEVLRDAGVERVITVGQEFSPELMEAIATGEGEEGKVIAETRPGFTLFGKILRPAQVKVGKGE